MKVKRYNMLREEDSMVNMRDNGNMRRMQMNHKRIQDQMNSILNMVQEVSVRYTINITNHANIRYMERMQIGWNDLLLTSDFAQQTLLSILRGDVKHKEKFVYQNNTNGCVMVLHYAYASFTENSELILVFDLITLFKGKYNSDINYRGQKIVEGGENAIAYDIIYQNKEDLTFVSILPINFYVHNIIKPERMNFAFNALKALGWKGHPLRVSAGCIRKILPEIIYGVITNKLRYKEQFTCIEPNGPLYITFFNNGFIREKNGFMFSFSYMSLRASSYETYNVYTVNNNNNESIKGLKSSGNILQNTQDMSVSYSKKPHTLKSMSNLSIPNDAMIPTRSKTYGADYVSENKNIIRITEGDLRQMISETIIKMLNEGVKQNTVNSAQDIIDFDLVQEDDVYYIDCIIKNDRNIPEKHPVAIALNITNQILNPTGMEYKSWLNNMLEYNEIEDLKNEGLNFDRPPMGFCELIQIDVNRNVMWVENPQDGLIYPVSSYLIMGAFNYGGLFRRKCPLEPTISKHLRVLRIGDYE